MLPRLEGLIEVAGGSGSGGAWRLALAETGGGDAAGNVDVAAGDYYLSASPGLLGALAAALSAVGNATYTVELAAGTDTATGQVTITAAGGGVTAFAIAWTDVALRNLLGFEAGLSGELAYTGPHHARHLWLPNCHRAGDHPDPAPGSPTFGRPRSDLVVTRAPSGVRSATRYATRHESRLTFPTVLGQKTWRALEARAGESLERFWRDVLSYGRAFRYYPDRSAADYWTLVPLGDVAQFPAQPHDPAHQSPVGVYGVDFDVQDYVAPTS